MDFLSTIAHGATVDGLWTVFLINRGPLPFDKLMALSHANGVISASKGDSA